MFLPVEVTAAAISTHGSMPLVAPQNPYTEFIMILYANCFLHVRKSRQSCPPYRTRRPKLVIVARFLTLTRS
jgi:hypothetical protein